MRTRNILTDEQFMEFQMIPYERDLAKAIERLSEQRIMSVHDVNKIWRAGGFLPDGWDWHQYASTEPVEIVQYVTDLLNQTQLGTGATFCDIGIGTSFPQAVLASLGFRTYGIDESDQALQYSPAYHEQVQIKLGFRYRHQPVNANADANSMDASFEFPDGTRMRDMDVIFQNMGSDSDIDIRIKE